MKETEEFIALQKALLKHKRLYYVEDKPILTDYNYDMMELGSYRMAKELGFRADRFDDPTPEEAHHVHWMVGYREGSRYE